MQSIEKTAEEKGFKKTAIWANLDYKSKQEYKNCSIRFETENL